MDVRRLLLLASLLSSTVLVVTPGARAESVGPYTSTADFDGGDKGLSSLPGSWSFKAEYPLQTSPVVHSYSGNVYAMGGFEGNGAAANTRNKQTYRYNVGADTWTSLADMPDNRSDMATAVWADRIYAFAGANDTSENINIVTYYNVTSNTWSNGAGTGVVVGVAGEGNMADTHGTYIYLSSGSAIYRYNPSDGTYVLRSATCTMGIGAVNAVIGDYWYFMGGKDDTTLKARRYDINGDSCDNAYDDEPFEARRYEGSYEGRPIVSGRLYFAAGFDGAGGANAEFYRTVWEWEPIGKTWRQMSSANIARSNSATSVSGMLYVMSGILDNGVCGCASRFVEALDPTGTTYDGRNQVDTITDAPNIVNAGEVRIASGRVEKVPRSDWVGDPAFWQVLDRRKYGSCRLTFENPNASQWMIKAYNDPLQACGIMTSWSFTGDFDVRGELRAWGNSGGFNAFQALAIPSGEQLLCPWGTQTACGSAPAVTGVNGGVAILRVSSGNLETYTLTDATFTACGAAVAGLGSPEYIRITRSSSTWTFYYGATSVDGPWTQATTCTGPTGGNMYAGILESGGTSGAGGSSLRDFYLATGTVGAGAYRTSGTWTTPTTSFADQRVTSITIDHSGLSANAYVDRVDILVDSAIVWSDTTDVTTGTQTVLFPAQTVTGATAVRVTLAGNGAASPVLESVGYEYQGVTRPGRPPPGIVWSEVLAIDCSAIMGRVTCVLWERASLWPLAIQDVLWLVDGNAARGWRDGDRWRLQTQTSATGTIHVAAHVIIDNGYDRPVLRSDVDAGLVVPVVLLVTLAFVMASLASWRRRKR